LRGNHHQKLLTKVRVVWANVRRDEFWDTCVNFVHMVEPILMSLRAFDGKQPCMEGMLKPYPYPHFFLMQKVAS
jgi:hypothetical protein